MRFPSPLIPATLIRRYKRFLFDAVLESGEEITGSCPNTGSMLGLTAPGSRIWLSEHDLADGRKYRHRFEMIEADGTTVGVNTGLPNRLAEEAIRAGLVADLGGYETIMREQKYGKNSRIDMLLSSNGRANAYVEVKNVHFVRTPRLAEFPDTVTARGAKHLQELTDMIRQGHRAVMIYLIQREDCDRFSICSDLDPFYAASFKAARSAGVEAYAVKCKATPQSITAVKAVPVLA